MPATERVRRYEIRCDVCARSLKPGWLWIGGNDYVECPQCSGTGSVPVEEVRVDGAARTVYHGSQRPRVELLYPKRTYVGGNALERTF